MAKLTYRQWVITQAALRNLNLELHGGSGSESWGEEDGPEPTSEEIDATVAAIGVFAETDPPGDFIATPSLDDNWHMTFTPKSREAQTWCRNMRKGGPDAGTRGVNVAFVQLRTSWVDPNPNGTAFEVRNDDTRKMTTLLGECGFSTVQQGVMATEAPLDFYASPSASRTRMSMRSQTAKGRGSQVPGEVPIEDGAEEIVRARKAGYTVNVDGTLFTIPAFMGGTAAKTCVDVDVFWKAVEQRVDAETKAEPEERTLFQVWVGPEGDTHMRFQPFSEKARDYFHGVPAVLGGWRRQLEDLIVPNAEVATFVARLREENFIVKVDERAPKFHVRARLEGDCWRFVPCTQDARTHFHSLRTHVHLTGGRRYEGDALLIPAGQRGAIQGFRDLLKQRGLIVHNEVVETPPPPPATPAGTGRFDGAVVGFIFKTLHIGQPTAIDGEQLLQMAIAGEQLLQMEDACMPAALWSEMLNATQLPKLFLTYEGREYVVVRPRVVGAGVSMAAVTSVQIAGRVQEEPPLTQAELRKLRKFLPTIFAELG